MLGVGAIVWVGGPPDHRASAVARLQRNLISRRQLLTIGFSDGMIHTRVRQGTMHACGAGVYAVGALGEVAWQAETEALLRAPSGALLAGATAAAVWALALRPVQIELIVERRSRMRWPGVIVHRPRTVPPGDRTVRLGLPVTAPARTLRDQSVTLPRRDLERQVEEALVQRLVTPRALRAAAAGAPNLRAALATLGEPAFTRSEAERRLLELIRRAGLPTPLTNVRRHGYEIDFLFPDADVAIEVDGYRFHGGRSAFERDRRKSNRLTAAGLTVLRVTWWRIAEDPLGLVAEIATAYGRRAA